MDNSALMLLRLLNIIGMKKVYIAGFDGYSSDILKRNYSKDSLEVGEAYMNAVESNKEISEMLIDFNNNKSKDMNVKFITPSRFEACFI